MNPIANIARDEISRSGPISFARFMELALYTPRLGYYERQKQIGCRGDFYTSVSVGPLFGQLLATQFIEWRNSDHASRKPAEKYQFVEAGAHDGKLAADILSHLRDTFPSEAAQIEYWIIEPSLQHQEWQRQTLHPFGEKVRWFTWWNEVPGINGIIFSNELLDAIPFQRFAWNSDKRAWFEWLVGFNATDFIWQKAINSTPLQINPEPDLLQVLPNDFTIEVSPAAVDWWKTAANKLEHGRILAIDYGLTEEEIFSPGRSNGTARAYYKHRLSGNLLAKPGEQDITVHVNFSHLKEAGEGCEWVTDGLLPQSTFLTQILLKMSRENPALKWDAKQTKQFQTLTHPEHLGRAFRVLVQSKRS